MTDLLAHVVQQQSHNPNPPVGNPENHGNHVESEDRALERFQKFSPPKFLGGPNPDVAERWLEKMVDIFAALHYSEERQGDKSTPPKFGRGAGGGRVSGTARGTPPRGGQMGRGQQRSASQRSSVTVSRGSCGFCGKPNHMEDNCWRKEKKCLRCGSTEHQIASCPVQPREARRITQSSKATSAQSKVEVTKSKVPALVDSIEQRPVPESAEVVEGTTPVFHRLARILIDPDATHSFVNPAFMCGINITLVNLPYELEAWTG
ncbi:uncharacterized protein LOC113771255 [Coffea eugenioides]|uniref:uncharacterized protein LOC113771255 n=1 Tax=Coffea eugenioides TaxID=49369 RepID=UPI000F607109|nr:uncharacterized protein LOC113771255 [Coffea eugenioides]